MAVAAWPRSLELPGSCPPKQSAPRCHSAEARYLVPEADGCIDWMTNRDHMSLPTTAEYTFFSNGMFTRITFWVTKHTIREPWFSFPSPRRSETWPSGGSAAAGPPAGSSCRARLCTDERGEEGVSERPGWKGGSRAHVSGRV